VRVHWAGAFSGAAAAAATLVPWVLAVRERPELLHAADHGIFRALVYVQPWLKGLHYWFRYPSLSIPKENLLFDFTPLLGAGVDRWLTPTLLAIAVALGVATMAIAVAANVELFRSLRTGGLLRRGPAKDGREFLLRYVVAGAISAIVVFAASPTTPQSWQGLALFHAATIPVALWVGKRLDREASHPGESRRVRGAVVFSAALASLLAVAVGTGARNFRCGGRSDLRYPLSAESPMLDDLGIQESCPWQTGVPGGIWPDGLPATLESSGAAAAAKEDW